MKVENDSLKGCDLFKYDSNDHAIQKVAISKEAASISIACNKMPRSAFDMR